ncbi:MAG: segregation/condensation protein A, partial [Clostridia bacterium]|nr:segregation/condensation protein A [Clostridia bacterium]
MHQLEEEARALLTKLPEEYPLPPPSIEITGLTLEKLAKAFKKVLERAEAAEHSETMAQREIRRDSFTVAGCMVRISRRLKSGGSCRFTELFAEDYSREEVITMFLAILELARLSKLHVEQGGAYDEIYLSA